MSEKIIRLGLKSLRNSEYTIFVNHIIITIGKYQPENLHLSRTYNKLTSFVPDIEKIKARELSNAISKILSQLDSERKILFKAIISQIKTLGKVDIPSISPNVLVLKHFINIHGDDIADVPYIAKTKRLFDLMADYKSKENVKLAAEALNICVLFDKLNNVNKTFYDKFRQRNREEAATEKINNRATRTALDKALKEFFDAFEFCSKEYEELDYKTPANELNNLIKYYKTHLKSRETRRKAGEDVSSETPITAPE